MRVAIVTVLYKGMLREFYERHPAIETRSFAEHEAKFEEEISLWAGGWKRALAKRGHQVRTITANNNRLLRHWSREHGAGEHGTLPLIVEQSRKFQPDVLWFDYFDRSLLREIKHRVPSLRLVLGWTGSHVVDIDILREMDLVLSCAPEAVMALSENGLRVRHLHHAFDPAMVNLLPAGSGRKEGFTFVGQIIRDSDVHDARELLLLKLSEALPIRIHSPARDRGIIDVLKLPVRQALFLLLKPISMMPRAGSVLRRYDAMRALLNAPHMPRFPYSMRLRSQLFPALYGISMLSALHQSLIVLNVHASSSPRFASNMRLFETTGVGTCLLTESRENLADLFEPDKELVTYASPEECVEKAGWLLDHPETCREIGEAAQRRVRRFHTYEVRSEQLESIIEEALRK